MPITNEAYRCKYCGEFFLPEQLFGKKIGTLGACGRCLNGLQEVLWKRVLSLQRTIDRMRKLRRNAKKAKHRR